MDGEADADDTDTEESESVVGEVSPTPPGEQTPTTEQTAERSASDMGESDPSNTDRDTAGNEGTATADESEDTTTQADTTPEITEPTLSPPSVAQEGSDTASGGDDPNLTPPTAPDELPTYVVDPLKRQSVSNLEAIIEFAESLIEFNSKPIADETVERLENEDTVNDVAEDEDKGVIVTRKVTCGTDTCQCMSEDEEDMHGPYKYRYFRNDRGEVVTDYIGPA